MRVRCKVLTHGGTEYMVAMGMAGPTGGIKCFAMSEERTVELDLTMAEWNALEYQWFQSDGAAPRRVERWTLGDGLDKGDLPMGQKDHNRDGYGFPT